MHWRCRAARTQPASWTLRSWPSCRTQAIYGPIDPKSKSRVYQLGTQWRRQRWTWRRNQVLVTRHYARVHRRRVKWPSRWESGELWSFSVSASWKDPAASSSSLLLLLPAFLRSCRWNLCRFEAKCSCRWFSRTSWEWWQLLWCDLETPTIYENEGWFFKPQNNWQSCIPGRFWNDEWREDSQAQRGWSDDGEELPIGNIVGDPRQGTRRDREENRDRHVGHKGSPFRPDVLENCNETFLSVLLLKMSLRNAVN